MEQTERSETSAYKIQTPGSYPEESIQQRYICMAESMIVWLQPRRSRRTCHKVRCGISSSRPALLVILRRLRWKSCLTRSTASSEGPGRHGCVAMYRHMSRWKFSCHSLMLFLAGESFPNLVRNLYSTATIHCVRSYSSTKQPHLSPSPPFSLNLLPWWPPKKLSARG